MAKRPREEELFEVCPVKLLLCRKFFENLSENYGVNLKRYILKALDRVERDPCRYISTFYTLIPEKTWNQRVTPKQLEAYAIKRGGHLADWTEQALEWAQRIINGETVKELYFNPDTVKWPRLVSWKRVGRYAIVGGGTMIKHLGNREVPPAFVSRDMESDDVTSDKIVPLIVYNK